MPPWLNENLIQFPIVGLVLWVAWKVYCKVGKDARAEADARVADGLRFVATLEAAYREHIASKDREIAYLRGESLAQLEAMSKRIDALARKIK